jgi:hypothetical protein
VIDGDMEKLREIFVFVCFIIAVGALILGVFQAWSGKTESAYALIVAAVVCAVFVFFSQIKAFKVAEVLQVETRETLNQAKEIIERLTKLAAISARASYLTIAWGNRLGTPPAKEKQAVLDEIDSQLTELKVSPKELADIQRPFVKMVRLDFFFLFQNVLNQSLRSSTQSSLPISAPPKMIQVRPMLLKCGTLNLSLLGPNELERMMAALIRVPTWRRSRLKIC